MRDSSPDRWGRHLIDRRAIVEAQTAGVTLRAIDEVDYLLGVFDSTRQGSLRYSVPDSDDWLSASNEVPPIIELKRLLFASNEIARGNERNGQIKELLDAGSGSLGGARPKASVVDEGKLLLAKFSHPGDEWDVIAWEKTALDIAGAAGMAVPSSKLVRIGGDSALLLERFDRSGSLEKGERIPYLSAMSLIGAYDGEHCDYTTVADALSVWTSSPSCELTELFRRVVLSWRCITPMTIFETWASFARRADGCWLLFSMSTSILLPRGFVPLPSLGKREKARSRAWIRLAKSADCQLRQRHRLWGKRLRRFAIGARLPSETDARIPNAI